MNPLSIISKYYDPKSKLYAILVNHSTAVTQKALEICHRHPGFHVDEQFISEAAMLHDIGIFLTHAPLIECYGSHQYIEHGYLGADILRAEGFPQHALVCERHTGTGLQKDYIIQNGLPLPHRDMYPVSLEEQIISYADKFFSKSKPDCELSIDKVRNSLAKFGTDVVDRFDQWGRLFLALILLNL